MELKACFRKKAGSFSLRAQLETSAQRNGVLGASGCGKSMTLKAIAGIISPDEGRIELNGRVLFDSEKKINIPAGKRNIGYLFQNYALFPNMTAEQNIGAGLKGGREENRRTVSEIMDRLQLTALRGLYPSQMSGGQKQRAALARILVRKPEVILLDEPFSALDSYMQDRMQAELLGLLKEYEGIAVMVSHDRDILYRFSEKLFVMGEGKFLREGKVKEIFHDPKSRTAAVLTGCKNISEAVRVDEHTLLALSWGITLHTERMLPEDLRWVGYHAHFFKSVYGAEQENCIRFSLYEQQDLPFEKNYYCIPEKETWKREDLLTWFVQREDWEILQEKGLPDYLQMTEENMLFLSGE